MDKLNYKTSDARKASTNNIWIPGGLLQSVNRDTGSYSRRRSEHNAKETQTLAQVIEQPAQAVLAINPLTRSRTVDYGPSGHPQIGLGRRPISTSPQPSRTISSREQRRQDRADSINVASSLRPQDRLHQHAPLLTQTIWHPTGDALLGGGTQRSTRPSESISPTGELLEGEFRHPKRSPTPRVGRTSIYEHPEAPYQLRQDSYAAGRESLTVRRPTTTSQGPRTSILRRASAAFGNTLSGAVPRTRQTSIRNTYENAKLRQKRLQRSKPVQVLFRYAVYLLLLAFVYFVLVGRPLWGGTVWYIYVLFQYHLTFVGGSAIFIGLAFFYAFGPLLVFFEPNAPMPQSPPDTTPEKLPPFPSAPFIRLFEDTRRSPAPDFNPKPSTTTALLIPCYKSAGLLPATLEHALKIFPATSIFVLANGNSPTPLDNTEEVCTQFGVNHIWIPVGSKIVAQYVGTHVARHSFPHVLLIDDDCLLPPNFPIVTDRLHGNIKCLGYTLTSIGANRSRGTWCQQAQDLEYKLSGLQRLFAGKIGSATFPHGAIVLWDTEFLVRTFKEHPGFSVSEDWFFGHVARLLGSRITMCSSVFVETETPSSVFFAARGGARGGFGEMTVFKQRFKRWNFFFVNGCWYNLAYILFSWRLGFWEVGAKLFVFQEVYETFLYLITPLVLPISFLVRPAYAGYLFAATLGLYFLNSMIFNEIHLRRAGKMVNRTMLIFYYMPFKFALTFINVASCWWSLWQYAKYFAKRHPRIVEDVGAVGVVLRIEEENDEKAAAAELLKENDGAARKTRSKRGHGHSFNRTESHRSALSARSTDSARARHGPRRLTVTAVKVDIVDGPVVVDQLGTQISRESDGVDPLSIQPIEAADDLTLSLTRSLTGGVLGQINNWTPRWSGVGGGQDERADLNVLEQVEEGLEEVEEGEEEEELGGYSYYDV